jgi:hypothetical protein
MNGQARRLRRRERWVGRAERARDAFGLVLVLVFVTYVLASLLEDSGWPGAILALATSVTSVVSLASARSPTWVVRGATLVAAISLLLALIAAGAGGSAWLSAAVILQIGLLGAATVAVLVRVVGATEVGSRTILGAISVYAVLGLLFGFVYDTVERIQSGPFFEAEPHPHGHDFLFFSYTTLTTTGYGDLVPGGQPGRMIAGIEMMVGQIFLVTLVAGLVSLWRPGEKLRQHRERRAERGNGEPAA